MLNAALALMLAVAPILTTPEAVDTTSFARPREPASLTSILTSKSISRASA